MTIKQKIVGKSLATALLVAAVGLFSAVSMFRIGRTLRATVVTELRETSDIDRLEESAAKIDGIIDNYGVARRDHQQTDAIRTATDVDDAFDQIAQATYRLDQAIRLQPADTAPSGPNAEGIKDHRRRLELIEQQARLSRDEWSKLRETMSRDGGAKASTEAIDRLTLATGAMLRDSQEFERGAKDDMMLRLQVAQDRVSMSVRLLIAAAVAAVILSLGMGLVVALPIEGRLARLRDGAVAVGKGHLDARIDVAVDDEIGQLAAAFNDMSAGLRRSRDEIRENESKFQELAEAIHEVFWVAAPDGSKVQYVNPAYEEVWGRSRESIYKDPKSFTEAIVPEDRLRVLAALDKMMADGLDQEYQIVRPDGTIRWIHDRGFAVRNERGEVQRMVGIAADVTVAKTAQDGLWRAHEELEQRVAARTAELQHANEALQRSETELQHAKDIAEAASQAKSVVFDTALDAIVTIDSRGVITAWNLQAETMFRWDRTEAVGMRLDQTIIPGRHWDAHRREIEAFVKTGEGPLLDKVVELVAVRRDGREFPVEVAITPACSASEWTFTAFIRDITIRTQAEADLRQARDSAEIANRGKSEFLAKMSHEIRTPLNGVIGMSDLLLETALDERQRRFAQLIKSSGESLSSLINDILDFSKIEARKLEIEAVEFDLHAAVEDVTEMLSMKAAEKRLDLACLTTPDVPRRVIGDPQRVKQILVNLVNNAIKFTEAGSITTRVTLAEQSPQHVTVRFTITDTGIGIPADRMDRLFKSFSQVDSSTTRTYGGTGLGLAISKQLAELMGGAIGVESTPGHGSAFWFTVRLGPGSRAPESVTAIMVDPRGLRVLAVHGSPMMREIMRSQLDAWGLEAETAPTGDEAMKMLIDAAANACPYHVAILDGELQDINTPELGKAIKARPEIARTVLLILLPADSDLEPTKLAEFSGCLTKPVRQSLLYDSIVDAMDSVSGPEKLVAKKERIASGSPSDSVHAPQWAKILIAEDNRVNQIVASEVLGKHGYVCDIVDNGIKAVAAVSAGGYDLVLMDCSMPEMDGFEASRQIRLAENANSAGPPRHMPIIALTANAINGDRERCLEAGMDDYVSKPLDSKRLIEAIQTLLAKSNPMMPAQPVIEAAATATPPSAIVSDEAPPVATDLLLDRCMGDAATVALILDEFAIQAVADLAEITRLVRSGDWAGTARAAHALKGASGDPVSQRLSRCRLQT